MLVGKQFQAIDDGHRAFIAAQKIFFVASAAPTGRVNVSPKGMSTLRVLGANEVAYLDTTGSGNETAAHLTHGGNPRLTIMMCAFDGEPVILRLYGRGTSHMRGSPAYRDLHARLGVEEMPGARQIVHLAVEMVQTSCGMGVPLFDYKEDRENLARYWSKQAPGNLEKYWNLKNMRSIDGLPTGIDPAIMSKD